MYDVSLVRKKRRRRIMALVSFISAIGLASLVMISFLGRNVGAYTISITNSSVKLALSQKSDFVHQSSYIRIEGIKQFEENTYRALPPDSILDNEDTPFDYGMVGDVSNSRYSFFKCTYYVKNVGNITANYTMDVYIGKTNKANDGSERRLDDTVRIMVYENDPREDTHHKRIFANAAYENNVDRDGRFTSREFVSVAGPNNQESDEFPLAETFFSSSIAARYKVEGFAKGDMLRYTVVMWLEGEDPQARGGSVPEGASIEFGVRISAGEFEY